MKLRYLIYGLRAKTRVVGKNPTDETSLPIIAAIDPGIMKFPQNAGAPPDKTQGIPDTTQGFT